MIDLNVSLTIAKKAAKSAGENLMAHFGQQHEFHSKNSGTNVYIDLDMTSNDIIAQTISEGWFALTDTPFLIITEESVCPVITQKANGMILFKDYTDNLDDWKGPCWVIDPICGSIAYARGIRDFIISIALVYDGQVLLAVVYDPCHNELFHAVLGKGAYLSDTAIHPSHVSELNEAVVSIEHKVFRETDPETIQNIAKNVRRMRTAMTCGLEMCYVACGRIDAVIKLDQAFYDYIGGALILAEASKTPKSLISINNSESILPFRCLGCRASFIASNALVTDELFKKYPNIPSE